jgi:hypothetical protein
MVFAQVTVLNVANGKTIHALTGLYYPVIEASKPMDINSSTEQILPYTCPSIQYRVRKELLGFSSDLPVMYELQDQILEDASVLKVTASQGPDGWLAWNFHGYDSMETSMRLLCEKGVEACNPVLARALAALENGTDRLERGLGRPGKILDDLGFGGGETIRAWLFALAGEEERDLVKDQIKRALDVFEFAARVQELEDIHEQHKNQLVVRRDACWPGIYHLRLLAWTKNWRTSENNRMMVESIGNLVRLSPIPNLYVKYKSQVVAPASFCMHHFVQDLDQLSGAGWMQWFHRLELLSRLGVVRHIPELERQVHMLDDLLQESNRRFTKKLNHPYFLKWGAYTGLALEKDWRSAQRRINDLTFRSLLILNYSGL